MQHEKRSPQRDGGAERGRVEQLLDQALEATFPASDPVAISTGDHVEHAMSDTLYPASSRELAEMRKKLAPDALDAFHAFGQKVFADGALPRKTKELIAVAVAHVTQCPYCIKGHTKAALRQGATREELMEAIWVAAEMRAGAAYAHSILAIDEMEKAVPRSEG
jgi:AhpD family alkylhydroperoxidase